MKFKHLKIYSALLLILFSFNSFSQENYKVVRGERPSIDVTQIKPDGYAPNRIRIKLSETADRHFSQKAVEATGLFSIKEIDQLNNLLGVKKVASVFSSTTMKSEFSARHQAWGFHRWYDLDFDEDQDIIEIIKKYSSISHIEKVEPIYHIRLVGYNPDGFIDASEYVKKNKRSDQNKWVPNDTRLDEQWHYNNTGQHQGTPGCDIKLFDAWEIQKGNPEVIVAVIDGGIEYDHPDLADNMWEGIGYNFTDDTPNVNGHFHGTHVAGTIGAVNNNGIGVAGIAGGSGNADGVRLMSCEVFGPNDAQGGFEIAPVWAADNGAVISQNSWGFSTPFSYNEAVLDAIDYFNANAGGDVMDGGITIFAAGNDESSGEWYPGCYSGSFAVAATNNNDQLSWYSNYDTWVDISAPGGETNDVPQRGVLSTQVDGSYGFYQGTSMACPHVSGVAALVLSHIPGMLEAEELKEILKETADDHYPSNPGYEGMLGTGRLNAHSALLEVDGYANGIRNPRNFKAEALSANEIEVSWELNDNSNPVILAYNTEPVFGTPSTDVTDGTQLQGGGTVLHVGSDTQFIHHDLKAASTYYYRIWSIDPSQDMLSSGRNGRTITHCSNFYLPIEEEFIKPSLPICWIPEGVDGRNDMWAYSHTNKSEGKQVGEIIANYVEGIGFSRLIVPYFKTVGMESINLKFKHYIDNFSSGLTFMIQTSTDGVNWNDGPWQIVSTYANVGPEEVEMEITQDLNSETTYVAFVISGDHFKLNAWYIDDMEIDGIPVGAPEILTSEATSITESSAIIGGVISDPGDAAVTSSGVVYHTKPNPHINIPEAVVVYTNPVATEGEFQISIADLQPGKHYYYKAFAENDIGLKHGEEFYFITECGEITPDYLQDFDLGELPPCWENVSNNDDPTQVWQFGTFGNGLDLYSNYAYVNADMYGGDKTQDTDLISPLIYVDGYKSITISFKHYFRAFSIDKATLKYRTNGDENWEDIQVWNTTTPNYDNYEYTIDELEDIETIQFAWNYTGSNGYYWSIDDIHITGELGGSLTEVVTLEPVMIDGNTVELRGMINPNDTDATVIFKLGKGNVTDFTFQLDGTYQGTELMEVSHVVTDLEHDTSYSYRIEGKNQYGVSRGQVVEFKTFPVQVEDIQLNNATVYPNPFTNIINIVIPQEINGEVDIRLVDITGRVIINQKANTQSGIIAVDASSLAKGVYIISLEQRYERFSRTVVK